MLNFIKKFEIKREIRKINKELNEIIVSSDITRFRELVEKKVDLEIKLERI